MKNKTHSHSIVSSGHSHHWIDHVHPSFRLVSMAAWVFALSVCKELTVLSLVFGVLVIMTLGSGFGRKKTFLRLGALTFALLPAWFMLPLFGGGEPVLDIGPFSFYKEGIISAALLQVKASAILSVVMFHQGNTSWSRWVWGAGKLGAPASLLGIFTFTLRYLPLLAKESKRTMTAARARGFEGRAGEKGYSNLASIFGSGLVRSYHRSERVMRSLTARGFTGKFYPLEESSISAGEIIFAVLSFVCVTGAVIQGVGIDIL